MQSASHTPDENRSGEREASARKRRRGSRAIHVLGTAAVLVIGLALTVIRAIDARHDRERRVHEQFSRQSERIGDEVQRRVNEVVFGLKASRAIFMASHDVQRGEFEVFVSSKDLLEGLHGAVGLGVIDRVQRSELDTWLARERADGAPDFRVRSLAEVGSPMFGLDDLYIIKYVFPREDNRPAWGLDVGSEANRREAIERAVRTGEPTISAKVTLVQDLEKRCGFLYFLPVYKPGSDPKTPEERIASLLCVVYAPVILENALRDVLETAEADIDVEIFDGSSHSMEHKLFDLDSHLDVAATAKDHPYQGRTFVSRSELHVGGRDWLMVSSSLPAFESRIDYTTSHQAFLLGTVISVLGAGVFWGLANGRRRAMDVALGMNRDLRRLSMIAQHTSNAVIITDAERRIEWVNEGFTRITGYTLGDVVGKVPGHVLQCELTDPTAVNLMRNALSEGEGCRAEIVNRGKHGRVYRLDIEIQPLRDDDGRLSGFMAIELDITEQHRAKELLQLSEHRFRKLADSVPVMIWIAGADKHCSDFNREWLEFRGRTLEQEYGEGWLEGVHPEDREHCMNSLSRAFDAREPFTMTYRLRRHDGEYRWIEDHGVPRFGPGGEFEGFAGGCMDVTDAVLAKTQLKQEAERLELTVRSANLGTWDWNVETGAVAFNDISQTMLGYEAGEWEPNVRQWERIVHPDDLPRVMDHLRLHLEGHIDEYRCEHRLRRKDGTWAWILDAGRVIRRDEAGRPLQAMGVHMDITSLREFAAELQIARAQADAANRAKSEFLANMSHEIRTPMTAILGFADLLAEAEHDVDPARRTYIETIKNNGEYLISIINDILDLSKIEAGKMTVEAIPTDPARLMREVATLMGAKAGVKGIDLRMVFDTAMPQRIRTDALRLRQVLTNLMSNAIKFTEKGGVTIRADVSDQAGGPSMLRIQVCDTGVGMTREQMSRLFEAFQQGDSSMTRRFGGTGLGLRISRMLARLLGGDLTVESNVGRGSVFTLSIPAVRVEDGEDAGDADGGVTAVRAIAPSGDDAVLSGVRIWVAEDGLDNQRLIRHFLNRAGADVRVFDNGRLLLEAMTVDKTIDGDLIEPPPCDIVVTDMQMPEMDGYTLAWRLRQKGWGRSIVALTAHAMSGDAARCIEAGCDRYASKPIDRQKLIDLLRGAAEGAGLCNQRVA